MATMTITITNVPSFAAVGIGYQFTGTVNLPAVVDGAIRINSMSLYYGYGRTYAVGPYLNATCGSTSFRTDYFTISETGKSSLKERTLNVFVGSMTVGVDHILRKNGRTITFTVAGKESSGGYSIDRPRGGNMTLTVDYTILQSSLTLNKTTADAGQPITATIKAGDAAYSHKLTFTAGSQTQTISVAAGVTSYAFTIPMEWLEEIPRATQLGATCRLDTYSGSTLMGSETKSFTLTCPASVVPACEVTASPVNGFEGLYLSGRSSAEVAIVNENALYGASVAGYQISGAGAVKALKNAVFGPLAAGDMTFTATVTDSRGRTGKSTVTVTVLPYAAPTLSEIEVYRSDAQGERDDAGAYIALKASAAYASAEGKNSLTLQGRYRSVAGAWSPWEEMTSGERLIIGGALLGTVSYEAQIQALDGVGNAANYTQRIPTSQVAFNLKEGGMGAAFGMYQEHDKRLSIPEDWRFYRGETDLEALIEAAKTIAENALAAGSKPLDAYPVGSTYTITEQDSSPAKIFGGTWTLIDKNFAPKYLTHEDTEPSFVINSGTATLSSSYFFRSGKTISGRITVIPLGALADTSVEFGSLNLEALGITGLIYTLYLTGVSDGGNGVSLAMIGTNGVLTHTDRVTTTSGGSLPANQSINYMVNAIFNKDRMLDDACNQFIWQRIE